MAYNTKAIITDVNGRPIPQYFDEELDQYIPLSVEPKAVDYFEGQSTITKNYSTKMNGISVSNDGTVSLAFTINMVTRTVYPGETYTAKLKPFTQLTVNATDKYRVEVLR